jgi:hypothetical protein
MRKPLEWALWSPRHALTVLAVMALLVVGTLVAALTIGDDTSRAAAPATPSSSPTTPPTTTSRAPQPTPFEVLTPSATTGERDEVPTSPAKSKADAQDAAEAFMASWLTGRTTSHAAWMTTMRPLVAPAMVPYLDMTPATAIPDTKVKTWGEAEPGNDYSTIPLLLADRTKLSLELVVWDGKWVVANMDEKR